MDKEENIKLLCEGMGWIDLGKQKNPYMMSFIPEERSNIRMNIYFTTMTVTVQKRNRFCETYKNVGFVELEKLLEENIKDEDDTGTI